MLSYLGHSEDRVVDMHRARKTYANGLIALLLALGSLVFVPAPAVQAVESSTPPGPDRVVPLTVEYTAYTWWMASWDNNKVDCSIVIDHEGQPTLGDIFQNCDANVYYDFKAQPPCGSPAHNACVGDYIY